MEVQLLFVVVPIRNRGVKLITQFQSIAELDAHFSMVRGKIFLVWD